LNELNSELEKDEIYLNRDKLVKLTKEISQIQNELMSFNDLEKNLINLKESLNLLEENLDETTLQEFTFDIQKQLKEVEQKNNKLFLQTLLNEKYDNYNAILTLHSGAGGLESYDFVNMLYRMYERFCQIEKLKFTVLDFNKEDVGFKSLTIKIEGENAYGKLKNEKGIHRLVRISPFDSNKRRHTTFASVEVFPEIEDDESLDLNEKDLKIDTYRSSGAGGQHVNTTDSAIRITHIPSGIVVTCQNQRSQIQNKETALNILKSKLLEIKLRENLEKISDIKGESLKIEWGSQIRSYVFCPYTMVKDHRTNFEVSDVESVMDGNLEPFILSNLIKNQQKK